MERIHEGMRPEANKLLTVAQAFEQLAVWLGITTEKVETVFQGEKRGYGYIDGVRVELARIMFVGNYFETENEIKTQCIVFSSSGFSIAKKLICFDFATQRLVIADTL